MSDPRHVRILAIHSHPDDIEFLCAGTLALLARRGHSVTIVTMTAGDCGSVELGPNEIAALRRKEAATAAAMLNADYACLEFPDLLIAVDTDSRRRVTEAVRRARPEIVITASPVDYMSDHELTSRLVRDACFMAPIPNFSTHQWEPAPPIIHIPHLYYVDPIEGVDIFGKPIDPDFRVDVTSVFETKKAMLACHASQRNWLLRQHGIDEYLHKMEEWSRRRGMEMGVDHAEGFRQHLGHAYPHSNLLLELLA